MSTTASEMPLQQQPALLDDIILHEDDLNEKAKSYFGYHSQILCAFEKYRHGILDNEHLTCVGRHLLFTLIDKLHTNCKRVLNYAADNMEGLSDNFPIVGPLIICGLPRSGTTFLYNLLSCDPNCRAPLFTDMTVDCVPPIARSNCVEQERRFIQAELVRQQRDNLTGSPNEMVASHPIHAIEEDYLILRHASVYVLLSELLIDQNSEADVWLDDLTKKNFAYDYHETFLRILNSIDTPRSHWLLKSSVHSFYLDTLFRHYPHAKLIMIHRNLDEVIPSFCRLHTAALNKYLDQGDSASRARLMKRSIQCINRWMEVIMDFRTHRSHQSAQLPDNIFDVTYDDLTKQPIETVRRIYDHHGLCWSNEFEMAMKAWLRDNPQGKQGRHSYSLTQFGLTQEDIEARHANYISLFLR